MVKLFRDVYWGLELSTSVQVFQPYFNDQISTLSTGDRILNILHFTVKNG